MSAPRDAVNPLLEMFAPFIPVARMAEKLLHEPLNDIAWHATPPDLREQYLELYQEHFFPTSAAVDIVPRIHSAILGGLQRRNPMSRVEQRRINQLALLQPDELSALPSLANPANAGIIAATTGMGKTSILERTLHLLAPDQVVVHSRSEACGWSKLTQIAYLKFDFPSNGSRGGLIDHGLGAIDSLIGTDYVRRVHRRNLEAGFIELIKQLSNHRVGLVVLDEVQPGTFADSPWYLEFVMFMLCLMNIGIPILLSGQPGAFKNLIQERQTLRRFSRIGLFELHRAASDSDAWWAQEFVPGMLRFNLCENTEGQDEILARSRSMSAGIPGYFSQLWIEAQRLALRAAGEGEAATITPAHLELATESQAIRKLMMDAKELELQALHDATDEAGTQKVEINRRTGNGKGARSYRTADNSPDAVAQAVHAARTEERRRNARAKKDAALAAGHLKELTGEDLRIGNHAMGLLSRMDELQVELSAEERP